MRALLALLALFGPAAATLGDNGLTTYTGRTREPNTMVFGNDMVTEQALHSTLSFAKDVLKGAWRPMRNDPPTEKTEVQLACLNSVAPEPLNWKMWCPGTDAKVYGWIDKSGAAHRQITLRPQKGMTSTMYQWFITTTVMGLMPPVVEFQGNRYHYYHLWHPLDHVESSWSMGPVVPIFQKGPPVYVLIHERYRNPPNFPYDRHYETNGWFWVEDSIKNLMKNRYVITMPYMGIPTWTMILEFNDHPEGLVVDVEVIAGIPFKGFDDRAPYDGYKMAAGLNELFTAPLLAQQKGSYDWEESINAITRHVIEEFSNLQHFVPYLYEKCNLLGKAGINWMPTLGTWLQFHNKGVADGATISFYHALEKIASKQVNMNNTLHAKMADVQIDIWNKTFLAGAKALTAANEHFSRKTFVPLSNKLTKLSYEQNMAHGAHPEVDDTVSSVKRGIIAKLLANANITTETVIIGGGIAPHLLNDTVNDTGNGTQTDGQDGGKPGKKDKKTKKKKKKKNKDKKDEEGKGDKNGKQEEGKKDKTDNKEGDSKKDGDGTKDNKGSDSKEDKKDGEGKKDKRDGEGKKGKKGGKKKGKKDKGAEGASSTDGAPAKPGEGEGKPPKQQQAGQGSTASGKGSKSGQQDTSAAGDNDDDDDDDDNDSTDDGDNNAEGDNEDDAEDDGEDDNEDDKDGDGDGEDDSEAADGDNEDDNEDEDDDTPDGTGSAGDAEDEDEDDEDDDEADAAAVADNPALALRQQLKQAQQEPERDTEDDEDDEDDDEGDDAADDGTAELMFESGTLNGTIETMDATAAKLVKGIKLHPKLKADISGVAVQEALSGNASSEAIEVPSVSLGNITATVRAGDVAHKPPSTLNKLKKEIRAALHNSSVSFTPGNGSISIPKQVVAALAAKHGLEQAALAALLNATQGLSASGSSMQDTAAGYFAGDMVVPSNFVAKRVKTVRKGGSLAVLLNNTAAGGSNVTIRPVSHEMFAKLAANLTQAGVEGSANATAVGVGQHTVTKPGGEKPSLQNSLKRLRKSINRAARLAKDIKPSLTLNVSDAAVASMTAHKLDKKDLQLKLRFWPDVRG